MFTAMLGRKPLAELLIERGADPDRQVNYYIYIFAKQNLYIWFKSSLTSSFDKFEYFFGRLSALNSTAFDLAYATGNSEVRAFLEKKTTVR